MSINSKAYDDKNVFARIICGEIPAKKIYEDEQVLAFEDIAKEAPIHVLIIPKGEFQNFDEFVSLADKEIVANFFGKIAMIARNFGVDKSGYRLITNHGIDACQSVPHFHVHLLAGRNLGAIIPFQNL